MEVRNCKTCGKLFNYIGGNPICPTCVAKLEETFVKVKEYIRDHKAATLSEVSEENDVSVMQIKKWIREERLSFTEDSVIGVECERCGTTIRTGRFCNVCKEAMAHNLESIYRKEPEPEKENPFKRTNENKMRFLNRD